MIEDNIQEWEHTLNERVNAILAQRLNPLNNELERLEQALAALRGQAAFTLSEDDSAPLAAQVHAMLHEAVQRTREEAKEEAREEARQQAEQQAEARLAEEVEKARAVIGAHLRQSLEEDFEHRLAQAKTEAQAQIAELQLQFASTAEAANAVAPATNNYPAFKAAVEDIDAQRTQSETLTALIRSAAQFAPRIAFFVVKGGEAIGWKARGFQNGLNDDTARSLVLSAQTPSLLSQALSNQTAAIALNPQQAEITAILGNYHDLTPRGAVAVPLVVRGKAAAVLYADSAEKPDHAIQLEAIETLIHVASMGIELLPSRRNADAARPAAAVPPQPAAPAPALLPTIEAPVPVVTPVFQPEPSPPTPQPAAPAVSFEAPSMPFLANPAFAPTDHLPAAPKPQIFTSTNEAFAQVELPAAAPAEPEVSPAPVFAAPAPAAEPVYEPHVYETNIGLSDDEYDETPETNPLTNTAPEVSPVIPAQAPTNALDAPTWMRRLESPSLVSVPEPSAPPPPMQKPSLANWGAKERTPDKGLPLQVETPSAKLADKIPSFNVPSEPPRYAAPSLSVSTAASETEVRAHNDARRFARLLVSEIKLYNAAKVNEGRRNADLYDRLRDEVDRSRKVYDKRVSPTVAAKFDYFYDELVQTLAEGDPSKLGESCPGPFVVTS